MKFVTDIIDALSWIISITDTFWYVGIMASFLSTMSTAAQINWIWELASTFLNTIYNPLSAKLRHGEELRSIPPPNGPLLSRAYTAFSVVTVFSTISSIIVESIVAIVDS